MLRPILVPALALSALAGCSVDAFTYTINRYGEVKGVRVRLGCNDAYEVFDKKEANSLVVVTNGINEAVINSCSGLAGLPRSDRMRRVADLYLDESAGRPECRVTGENPITEFHTEFSYRCQASRAPQKDLGRRP
jgi:hypothetical protein